MLKVKIMGVLVRYGSFIPDKLYLKMYSRLRTGKTINFKDPKTFNDKINWIKIYDRRPIMTKLADKYLVREYIKEKLGKSYLIPLLWVGDDPVDIPFNKLPNQYVIKTNHASGTNIIVTDSTKLDKEKAILQLKSWLSHNYYYPKREWAYKDIKRKIIIEEFIGNKDKVPEDYKFFVLSGKVRLIQVDHDGNIRHTRSLYDPDWNKLDYTLVHEKSKKVMEKPKQLKQLIKMAELIGRDFTQVRVDFYIIQKRIFFGEITFYHAAGFGRFIPDDGKWNEHYGEFINLK